MAIHTYLAHGASGTAATMRPYVDGLGARGLSVSAVSLPKGTAERAVPVYRAAVTDPTKAVVGGQSFGGRVASMVAAEGGFRGVVLFCYPLHLPGKPERETRTAHLFGVACPMLFLSGERDPFAQLDLLRAVVAGLPHARLHTYPGIGHGLGSVLDDALDRVAAFNKSLG